MRKHSSGGGNKEQGPPTSALGRLKELPILLGLSMALVGLLSIASAKPLGFFLYRNYESLPDFLRQTLYRDYFSEAEFTDLVVSWSLPPAVLLVLGGVLVFAVAFTAVRQRNYERARLWNKAFAGVAIAGIILRTRAYLSDRSLWLDESFLALNFRDRSLAQMSFATLEYSQVAPLGFLTSVEFVSMYGDLTDLSLRLSPFLFGCSTVLVALSVSCRLFIKNSARLVFLLLISFSPSLVYYSQELKQYSAEVFAAMLSLYLLTNWGQNRVIRDGFIGGLIVLLAIPGPLLLISVAVAASVFISDSPKLATIARGIGARATTFGIWLVFGLVHLLHLTSQSTPESRATTTKFWANAGGFPPGDGIGSYVEWLVQAQKEFIWTGFGQASAAIPGVDGPGLTSIMIGLFLLFGLLIVNKGSVFALTSISLAIFLASLNLYPSSGRVWLYLIPSVAILLANILEMRKNSAILPNSLAETVRVGVYVVLAVPVLISLITFGKPAGSNDMKWLISQTDDRRSENVIVVSPDKPLIDWYGHQRQISDTPLFTADHLPIELASGKQIWIIKTHYDWRPIAESFDGTHIHTCSFEIEKTYFVALAPLADSAATRTDCSWVSSFYG